MISLGIGSELEFLKFCENVCFLPKRLGYICFILNQMFEYLFIILSKNTQFNLSIKSKYLRGN